MKECIHCGALLDEVADVCKYCTQAQDGSGRHDRRPPPRSKDEPRGRQNNRPKPPPGEKGRTRQSRPFEKDEPTFRPPPFVRPAPPPAYAANKILAGLLALTLGTFGIHKFYLGKNRAGIVFLLFCWTGFPTIVGIIEGITYLAMDDATFHERYHRGPPGPP